MGQHMAGITFVRHGQASFGSENYDKLSPLGLQQAEILGNYFTEAETQFDYVVGGTMQRHKETFMGINQSLKITQNFHTHKGWNEYDHEALFKAYLTQYPDDPNITFRLINACQADRTLYYRVLFTALQTWAMGKLIDVPETWVEFCERIQDAMSDVANNVSHYALVSASGGSLSLALMIALNMPVKRAIDFSFQMKNTAVNQLFLSKGKWQLHTFNSMTHLDTKKYRHLISYG
jgi:broad specificity phosphatase PhoE